MFATFTQRRFSAFLFAFCTLLRSFALFWALFLRTCVCALLRSFALVCALLWSFAFFALFSVFLRPTAFRATAFGNFRISSGACFAWKP